jgi:hypothetical protein
MSTQFPVAKGPITYCLDRLSTAPNAREALGALKQAIQGLAGIGYQGLEKAFEIHLCQPVYMDVQRSSKVTAYLKQHWFDASSVDAYFRDQQPIAEIYAAGVINAIDESLKGAPDPIPIDAWWVLGHPGVQMITLVSKRQVTLLIATAAPPSGATGMLWDQDAQALATGRTGIETRKLPHHHRK